MPVPVLSPAAARRLLLHATALTRPFSEGGAGAVELLERLGCIQLDPIDRVSPNAELVAFARVPGLRRGELHGALAGVAFEHFAKERCLIHRRVFGHYRHRVVETSWWKREEWMKRVDEALLADVLAEVVERGPLTTDQLADRGKVEPLDWSGWKSTSSRSSIAVEVLWARCDLVVGTRDARGRRVYDVPGRALGVHAEARLQGDPGEALLLERVASAGMLSTASGPAWSVLRELRKDGTVERLVGRGAVAVYGVEGTSRTWLALPSAVEEAERSPAPRVPLTLLAPLDPLLWDRDLVRVAFGFDYVWEVYKPAPQRRWGYYVCPLLRGEHLVGRLEARRDGGALLLERLWEEEGHRVTEAELAALLASLAARVGCEGWARSG